MSGRLQYGRNGTAVGVTKRAGLFGTEAIGFRGATDSYVDRPTGLADTIASNDTHSISFWVMADSLANNPVVLATDSAVSGNYIRVAASNGTASKVSFLQHLEGVLTLQQLKEMY